MERKVELGSFWSLEVGKAKKDFLRQFAQGRTGLLKKDSCPKSAKIKF